MRKLSPLTELRSKHKIVDKRLLTMVVDGIADNAGTFDEFLQLVELWPKITVDADPSPFFRTQVSVLLSLAYIKQQLKQYGSDAGLRWKGAHVLSESLARTEVRIAVQKALAVRRLEGQYRGETV